MSTNYYFRSGRSNLHVGQNAGGWRFLFQAYDGNEGHPVIMSIKDWVWVFTTDPGLVEDEYHKTMTPTEFVNTVVDKAGRCFLPPGVSAARVDAWLEEESRLCRVDVAPDAFALAAGFNRDDLFHDPYGYDFSLRDFT